MTDRQAELRIEVSCGAVITATAHMPAHYADRALLLLLFAGSGYGRGYYDLPAAEFSQAEAHVAAGHVVIAIDPLGVGDSTALSPQGESMERVAATSAEAVAELVRMARAGVIGPAFEPAAVVAAGQSMGGFIVTAIQARHGSFDGIALLGSSAVGTKLPVRDEAILVPPAERAGAEELAAHAVASIDWPWAFHWDDEAGRMLRERDIAAGLPHRTGDEPWISATSPSCVRELMVPGAMAADAARVTVPVLLVMGERDVCHAPLEEAAVFVSATDIAVFTAPRMAHMHNFAETRGLVWTRFEQFARQVAALKAAT